MIMLAPSVMPNRYRLQTVVEPRPLDAEFPIRAVPWVLGDEPIRRLHRHDALEVGLCLQGEGSYLVEDKLAPFAAGSVVVVGPDEFHYSQSRRGTRSRWDYLFIDPERLVTGPAAERHLLSPVGLAGRDFGNVLAPQSSPSIGGLVRSLIDELRAARTGRGAVVRGLAWAMMGLLQRARDPGPGFAGRATLDLVGPALRLIETRYAQALCLSDLASACHLPTRSFSRSFLEALREPPMRFLNRYRIERACERLKDPRALVIEASLDVGFNSLSAFNKHFRAFVGCTPQRWRAAPWPGRA